MQKRSNFNSAWILKCCYEKRFLPCFIRESWFPNLRVSFRSSAFLEYAFSRNFIARVKSDCARNHRITLWNVAVSNSGISMHVDSLRVSTLHRLGRTSHASCRSRGRRWKSGRDAGKSEEELRGSMIRSQTYIFRLMG